LIRTTVDVEVRPRRARRGAEVRVAVTLGDRAPRIWLRIIDANGLVVFRRMPIARRARRALIIVGTRFFRAPMSYLVQASPNQNLTHAGTAAFRLERRRGRVPPLLLVPLPVPGGAPRREELRPEAAPPEPEEEAAPPPGGTRRPDSWRPRIRDSGRPEDERPGTDEMETGPGRPPKRRPGEGIDRWRRRRDEWRRDRKRERRGRPRHPDLDSPVKIYVFVTERDTRVCHRCRRLDGAEFWPREWRPAIPVHPRCRCHWRPEFVARPKSRGRRGSGLRAAISVIARGAALGHGGR